MKDFVNSLGLGEVLSIQPLAQDASDRRFYRVFLPEESFVLMEIVDPRPFVDAPVKLYHPTDGELPYVNIGRYLRRIGVPVPRVVGADEAGGLVLL